MNNVTPLRKAVPSSDPVRIWGESLIDQNIAPDDIPGPLMRQVVDYLADEVRQARFAARAAIDAVKASDDSDES